MTDQERIADLEQQITDRDETISQMEDNHKEEIAHIVEELNEANEIIKEIRGLTH